jgi:quercetin dioxygenase-like cupin family protein
METTLILGSFAGPTRMNWTLSKPTRRRVAGSMFAAAMMLCPIFAFAAEHGPVPAATVAELITKDLISAPGQEVLMLTVTYVPGGSSLPHRHDAQVFVYVLEGAITMQLKGGAPVTLRAGQSFYEGPGDIHQVSANASRTLPAKILVVMVKDKAKPVSRDVTDEAAP